MTLLGYNTKCILIIQSHKDKIINGFETLHTN